MCNHGKTGYKIQLTCEHCGGKRELIRILCHCTIHNKSGEIHRQAFCCNCGKETKHTGIDKHKDVPGKRTPGRGIFIDNNTRGWIEWVRRSMARQGGAV